MDDNGNVTFVMNELSVDGYSCGSYTSGSGSGDFQFASYTSFSGDSSSGDDDDDDGYGNGGNGGGNGNGGNNSNGGNGGGGGYNNSGNTNPVNGGESGSHIVYSQEEALELMDSNLWKGGYGAGLGYVMPQLTVLPSSNLDVPCGQAILDRATTFSGVPYKWGGVDMDGIDCSGLVSAALNIDRWVTGYGDIPTTTRVSLNASDASFVNELQVGDILVWTWMENNKRRGHCCIYAGNGMIFHAHGREGSPTGYTSDLITFWFNSKGLPKVYRR